jgi:hypothetical protein
MTIILGVNADPAFVNSNTLPNDLYCLGTKIVRFPLWEDTGFDYVSFTKKCYESGVQCMAVLDSRALRYPARKSNTYRMKRLFKKYPYILYWQIGNEPDGTGESSSALSVYKFVKLLADAYVARLTTDHSITLVAGGLCFGNPSFVDELYNKYAIDVMSSCDAIAVHHYGVYPNEDFPYPATGFGPASASLASVSRFGLPTIVTEFGGEIGLFDDEAQRAEWLRHMVELYNDTSWVTGAIWFCYHDYLDFGMKGETLEVFKEIANG